MVRKDLLDFNVNNYEYSFAEKIVLFNTKKKAAIDTIKMLIVYWSLDRFVD